MQYKSRLWKVVAAAVAAWSMISLSTQSSADGSRAPEPMELRKIMQELGENMQDVTDGISREDWPRVAESALLIAGHRQPPAPEKVRILGFIGGDAARFRGFDEQVRRMATALEQAATHADGQAVIASFADLQSACLSCHQAFREPFVEHFYDSSERVPNE